MLFNSRDSRDSERSSGAMRNQKYECEGSENQECSEIFLLKFPEAEKQIHDYDKNNNRREKNQCHVTSFPRACFFTELIISLLQGTGTAVTIK
jgi:hypothetical protein